MIYLKEIRLHNRKYTTKEHYPFNLEIFQKTDIIEFTTPITFFIGENGTGKSTLLRAISKKCGIHIWEGEDFRKMKKNPYEQKLHTVISAEWTNGLVPGSFFGSQIFQNFTKTLEGWAVADPGIMDYFGGRSLVTQSHGQSLMSYFKSRYRREGIYFLDEPETALSPKSLVELLKLLKELEQEGQTQFIIATHSPILMAYPGAVIYNFDNIPITQVEYEETEYYRVYKDFMEDRSKYIQ